MIGDDVYVVKCEDGPYLFDNVSASVAKLDSRIDINNDSHMQQLYGALDANRPHKRIITAESVARRHSLGRIMIYLTDACNMRCIYCHCESGIGCNMSDKTILQTINKYCEHIEDRLEYAIENGDSPQITFMGGGEPFLRIDKIKRVVGLFNDRCKASGLVPKYVLVTNATLGSDADWDWLIANQFQINLSIDGPESIQNRNRPLANEESSHLVVEQRLRYLSSVGAKVHIRSTVVDPRDVKPVCEYFKQFDCVESHALEPVSMAGRAKQGIKSFDECSYSSFFSEYANYLFEEPGFYKSSWFKPFNRTMGFCGAVYANSIVLVDGTVALCSEVSTDKSEEQVRDLFLVSSVYDDGDVFESEKAKMFASQFELNSMQNCKTCIIKYKCGGGCYIKKVRDYPSNLEKFYRDFCEPVIRLNLSYLIGSLNRRQND